MKTQLAMLVDSAKCIDCKACMLSCKVANAVPEGAWRNWIKPGSVQGRLHFQPGGCMHCENPTCVQACPTGATYKDPADGTVKIDRSLCIGCGNCIPACPYGARYRHPELKVADKCDFCAGRRAQGLQPACVDTCPTKARVFGDIADPGSEAGRLYRENQGRLVRVANARTDTKPNMFYLAATAPLDWPVEARMPSAMGLMAGATPLLRGLVGLTGLGVLAMLGRQLASGSTPDAEERKEDAHVD